MKTTKFELLSGLVTLFLIAVPYLSYGQSSGYKLYARINPDLATLYCKCEIQNPGDSSFFLTKDLKITNILADNKKVLFHQKSSTGSDNSYIISFKGELPDKLVVEYSGKIVPESYPGWISSMNMIRPGLVELSDHIKWFPVMKSTKPFLYKLEVSLPSDYKAVTNLSLTKKSIQRGQILSSWDSSEPSYGITLVASPDLKMRSTDSDGIKVEIYFTKLPVTYIDSMKNDLLKTMEIFTGIFGTPGNSKLVRVIYSPRPAGGYARAPLIMVSENFALEQRGQMFGRARDFRLNAHEIAHYWSRANTNSPDDWINEGLAEYSALLISDELIGKDFSRVLLDEYKEIVKSSKPGCSIAETPGDSPDRELNHYYRPALLLNDLHEKSGDLKMKMFLKELYILFNETKHATTPVFLEAVEKVFGKDTRVSFAESLYRKDQLDQENTSGHIYTFNDSVFIGKWSGPLTQFGATVRFVLNMNIEKGFLVPTCDSPDQNVFGIPVSDLIMKDDSISFKVGGAVVKYRGYLNRANKIINGEFKQRGGIYPLNLTKAAVLSEDAKD